MTEPVDTLGNLATRMGTALLVGSQGAAPIVAITIPAPLTSPTVAFSQYGEQPAYYFATGDKGGDVGLGAAVSLESSTTADLAAVESHAQTLLDHALEVGIDAAARTSRFYGGMTFDRAPIPAGPWSSFARFRFDLPRYRYLTDGQRASLTLTVRSHEIAESADRDAWIARVGDLLGQLAFAQRLEALPVVRARRDQPSVVDWLQQVEAALSAMQTGSLEKVVLAREVTLEFDGVPNVSKILDNLNALSPETTRFAFRRGRSVFLGATPERLVLRHGSELRTEAVAGSIRALDADAAEHLMASGKERFEHDLVVRELVRKLELMGARVEVPHQPSIRQLRHVLHLSTSITARLLGPPHVLTLMSRLHPTPAVGGVPEDAAREFMRQQEDFERGWYAAPIGWFDVQGDGEFFVALRSGLLTENVLRLYAGAGIVRDSQPDKELQETELKLQSLLEAIGSNQARVITTGPLDRQHANAP
jgi:menaquinone-specific isochorismate synthase